MRGNRKIFALNQIAKGYPLNRLIDHLRVPLFRNGYALVLSSAITSGFGLVFWILAARNYTTEFVGLNSALISIMIFLAKLSHFNLTNALNRFLPTAGGVTGQIIIAFYMISLVAALASSLLFIRFVEFWTPTLGFLKSSPYFILGFAVATMSWCIFSLQDSALVGLRQATWVPIENLMFALLKIVLIVGFANLLPKFGIFASWTISVVVLIVPVNLLIFQRMVRKHMTSTKVLAEPVLASRIVKFVAGDYFASLIGTISFILLPLIVIERCGASANAYYYMPWTMAYSLYLVSQNMGMSLITETATDKTKLGLYSYRTFIQTVRLIGTMVAVMVFGAPYILRLFGSDYASEGTLLLRLLCISMLPNIVTSLYLSIVRVQRRMKALILVQTSLCALVLTLSYILLGIYGITGIGMAWLLSQSAVAAVLMLTQLGKLWLPHFNVQILLRLLALPRNLGRHWCQWRHKADTDKVVSNIASKIAFSTNIADPTTWCVQDQLRTVSDLTVLTLGPQGLPPTALLKLPQSQSAVKSLRQHKKVLKSLRAHPRLSKLRTLLPTVLAENDRMEQCYLVEQMMPGIEARKLLYNADICKRMLTAASSAIADLHSCTAISLLVDAEMLKRWVDRPISILRGLLVERKSAVGHQRVLDRLTTELHGSLINRTLSVSWVHGDFTPGNILLTADAAMVTGILDWDQAAPEELPQLDLVLLFLATRMLKQRCELGDIIREILSGADWTSHELHLLNTSKIMISEDKMSMREMVLLAWLRHTEATLTKATRYKDNWWWRVKNIEGVLEYL